MFTLIFSEKTRGIAANFVVISIDVAAIKREGWSADNFVSEARIISGRLVKHETWKILERSIFGDVARFHTMESREGARERLGVIVAIFDGEVNEFGARIDKIGCGAGKTALADILGEIGASNERKKSAHDVGIGMHMRGETIIIDIAVEMLLDVGSDLVEGMVDVHGYNSGV